MRKWVRSCRIIIVIIMRMTDKYIIMQCQSIVSSGLIQEWFCENCCLEGETGPDIRKMCAMKGRVCLNSVSSQCARGKSSLA